VAADSVSVISPEGVVLEMPIAGPGPRILAYGVDMILSFVLGFLLLVLILTVAPTLPVLLKPILKPFDSIEAETDPDAVALALLPLFFLFVLFLAMSEVIYFTFFDFVTGGRSPGKMLLGLRVTSDSGMPLDLRGSLVRNIFRFVDVLPSNYAIGLITMMLSERWQRLGDLAAGTVVIRTDRLEPAADLDGATSVPPLSLSREQLARLGERELALARGTLRRLERVEGERAEALLHETVTALRKRLGIEADEVDSDDDALFLRRVISSARSEARRWS